MTGISCNDSDTASTEDVMTKQDSTLPEGIWTRHLNEHSVCSEEVRRRVRRHFSPRRERLATDRFGKGRGRRRGRRRGRFTTRNK